MAFALRIKDSSGHTIVHHVAMYADDRVFTDDEDLPQSEWRKAHHLTSWVKDNKPNWKIEEREFDIETVFK